MIDVRMVGGIIPFRKVAAVAEMWHRPAVNHMMTAIDMHIMAGLPNAGLSEYVPWSDAIFDQPIGVVDGEAERRRRALVSVVPCDGVCSTRCVPDNLGDRSGKGPRS